jgi:ankyrin repeat protein
MTEENELMEQNNNLQLFEAVKNGSVEDVQELLNVTLPCLIKDDILLLALQRDDTEILRILLKVKACVTDNRVGSALHMLALNSRLNLETAELILISLMSREVSINAKNANGDTPLHFARSFHTARLFLKHGSDVSVKNNIGNTPLHDAISYGGKLIKLLLVHNANPNEKIEGGLYSVVEWLKMLKQLFIPKKSIFELGFCSEFLDDELIQQIKAVEEFRDIFKKGESARSYARRLREHVDSILSSIHKGDIKFDHSVQKKIERQVHDGWCSEYGDQFSVLHELNQHIKNQYNVEHDLKYFTYKNEELIFELVKQSIEKYIFIHNNKLLIDVLLKKYYVSYEGYKKMEFTSFKRNVLSIVPYSDLGIFLNVEIDNKIVNIDTLSLRTPALYQLAYVEVLRLLENGRHEELKYRFGKFIKAQEANIDKKIKTQNAEDALNDIRYLYKGTDEKADTQPITGNGKEQQPEVPVHNPIVPLSNDHDQNRIPKAKKKVRFEDDVDQQQNPQTNPQRPKNNSSYCYLGSGAITCLAISLTIAYFAGDAVGVFIAAAAVGMFVGAGVGYAVSKRLDNLDVEAHKQPEIQQHFA